MHARLMGLPHLALFGILDSFSLFFIIISIDMLVSCML